MEATPMHISRLRDLRLKASSWKEHALDQCRPLNDDERMHLSTEFLRCMQTLLPSEAHEGDLSVASELFCLDEHRNHFQVRLGGTLHTHLSETYVFSRSPLTLPLSRLMRAVVTAYSRRASLFRAAHFLDLDMDTGVVDYLTNGYPEHRRPVGRALRMATYFETVWDLARLDDKQIHIPIPRSAELVRLIQRAFPDHPTKARSVALHTPLLSKKRVALYRLGCSEPLPTFNGRGVLITEGDIWEHFYHAEGRDLHEREVAEPMLQEPEEAIRTSVI